MYLLAKEVNGLLQMITEKSGYSMKTILKNFSEVRGEVLELE